MRIRPVDHGPERRVPPVTGRGIRGAVIALLLSGCGGDAATGPDGETPSEPPSLTILSPPVVTISGAEETTVSAEARDSDGATGTIDPRGLVWTTSAPDVAEVVRVEGAAATLRATAPHGFTWVLVTGPATLRDSVGAWVQPPETDPSTFRITLAFTESVSDTWRDEFTAAARRWEEVIRLELPGVPLDTESHCVDIYPTDEPPLRTVRADERGTVIHVTTSLAVFDDQPSVSAAGAVCAQRPLPRATAVYGLVTLNRRLDEATIDPSAVRHLAVHETGHALGLVGSFIEGLPSWITDGESLTYSGVLALEGYRRAQGRVREGLPISGGHWLVPGDVMSGTGSTGLITELSVGALMDSGFPAAWYGAGDIF